MKICVGSFKIVSETYMVFLCSGIYCSPIFVEMKIEKRNGNKNEVYKKTQKRNLNYTKDAKYPFYNLYFYITI